MKIERKSNQENMSGQFPEWENGKVVEIFQDGGVSCGLYIMSRISSGFEGQVLISLARGTVWSVDNGPFDGVDYAIEVKGKFVEE